MKKTLLLCLWLTGYGTLHSQVAYYQIVPGSSSVKYLLNTPGASSIATQQVEVSVEFWGVAPTDPVPLTFSIINLSNTAIGFSPVLWNAPVGGYSIPKSAFNPVKHDTLRFKLNINLSATAKIAAVEHFDISLNGQTTASFLHHVYIKPEQFTGAANALAAAPEEKDGIPAKTEKTNPPPSNQGSGFSTTIICCNAIVKVAITAIGTDIRVDYFKAIDDTIAAQKLVLSANTAKETFVTVLKSIMKKNQVCGTDDISESCTTKIEKVFDEWQSYKEKEAADKKKKRGARAAKKNKRRVVKPA